MLEVSAYSYLVLISPILSVPLLASQLNGNTICSSDIQLGFSHRYKNMYILCVYVHKEPLGENKSDTPDSKVMYMPYSHI